MSIEAELAAVLEHTDLTGGHDPEDWPQAFAAAVLDFLADHDPDGACQDEGSPLLALHNWPSNAHMIADIAARPESHGRPIRVWVSTP